MSHPTSRSVSALTLSLLLGLTVPGIASAEPLLIRARLLAGVTQFSSPDLDSLLTSQNFKTASLLPRAAVEISRPIFSRFEVGLRYQLRFLKRGLQGLSNEETTPFAALRQDSFQAMARVSLIQTKLLWLDVGGGIGGYNTQFEFKNTSQDGELSKSSLSDFGASPMYSFGASGGIGAKGFYLVGELGYERSRVTDLQASGSMPTNVQVMDLSGPYFMLGMMFDGLTATSH